MIEETATVVAINDHSVIVKSTIKSTCHSCHQQDDCGSGQIAKAIPQKILTTELFTEERLQIGDEVVIGLPEGAMLASAFEVYMFPLIGLVLFAALGQFVLVETFTFPELIAILTAMLGGFFGYLFAKKRQGKSQNVKTLQPKLLRKCQKTISVTQI